MKIIGERCNGMFLDIREGIQKRDPQPLIDWAKKQEEMGSDWIDLNAGPACANEEERIEAMKWMVEVVQPVTKLPLALDSTNYDAIEEGLKLIDPDKREDALINSVPCEQEKMDRVFQMAADYGCKVVCLTMDAKGVPQEAESRVAMAMELIANADAYGVEPDRLYIDPLILPCNVAQFHCPEVLKALAQIKTLAEPAPNTVLGLSNVSQKSPDRSLLNRTYLAMGASCGLDAVIADPCDDALMEVAASTEVLLNLKIYADSYVKVYREKNL